MYTQAIRFKKILDKNTGRRLINGQEESSDMIRFIYFILAGLCLFMISCDGPTDINRINEKGPKRSRHTFEAGIYLLSNRILKRVELRIVGCEKL
jgi:hypothetical protein